MWLELLDNREVSMPQVCECVYVEVKERNPESQTGVNPVSESDYFRQTGGSVVHRKTKGRKKQVEKEGST